MSKRPRDLQPGSSVVQSVGRRRFIRNVGALGLGAATGAAQAPAWSQAAPAVARGATLTVSTWGGVMQDGVKNHLAPEFEKQTGAKLAYDIGGQGARYNKLLAQRASPPADVFFSNDEAVVAGFRAGIFQPARRRNVPLVADVHAWAATVKDHDTAETIPGVPFTLISYVLAFNPAAVKNKPTGWADMWRPEFRGKFALAAPVHSQMPAFVIVAAELAGGSATDVGPGFKKLAELKPSKLTVFWTDWAPLNKTGEVILATEFDYYLETMKAQKYPIDYIVPKDKGMAVPEYVTIVKGTKYPELAEVFLNLMLSAKVQEALAIESYMGPTSKKVSLSGEAAERCAYGAKVDQLRFFDPRLFVDNRAVWTERLNTEVVPHWR